MGTEARKLGTGKSVAGETTTTAAAAGTIQNDVHAKSAANDGDAKGWKRRGGFGRVRHHVEDSSRDIRQQNEVQLVPRPLHRQRLVRANALHERHGDAFATAEAYPRAGGQEGALRVAAGQDDSGEGRQSGFGGFEGGGTGEEEEGGRRGGKAETDSNSGQIGGHEAEEAGISAISETIGSAENAGAGEGNDDEAGTSQTAVHDAATTIAHVRNGNAATISASTANVRWTTSTRIRDGASSASGR